MDETVEVRLPSPRKGERIEYIDTARGIAILFVVLGHIVPAGTGIGRYVYSFHMPAFFIITGFLLFQNDSWMNLPVKEFLKKKTRTLLYPYFSLSLLDVIKTLLGADLSGAIDRLFATVTLEGIAALWFLPALFLAEVFFYILAKKPKKDCLLSLLTVFVFTTAFSYLGFQKYTDRMAGYLLPFINEINRSLLGLIFIVIGFAYGKIHAHITGRPGSVLLALLAFSANIVLFRFNYVDLHYSIIGNPILFYTNAVAGSYVLLFVSEKILYKIGFLRFLGKNSIIIFATHVNFGIISVSRRLINVLAASIPFFQLSPAFGVFVITMIIETILTLFIKKYLYFIIDFSALQKRIHNLHRK